VIKEHTEQIQEAFYKVEEKDRKRAGWKYLWKMLLKMLDWK